MPLWVFLAFSSINTRKSALILIWACVAFSIYCIPWSHFLAGSAWAVKVFLVEDWSWFVMMVPITFWYWMSLRWIDGNSGWTNARQG